MLEGKGIFEFTVAAHSCIKQGEALLQIFLEQIGMSATDVHFLLSLRNQLKLYHWQTKVYARHMAVDKVLAELDTLIDSYVEIYIGKYGRPKVTGDNAVLRMHNLTDAGAQKLAVKAITYMQKQLVSHLKPSEDSDLINLRDEMVGQMHQLMYLFTLH